MVEPVRVKIAIKLIIPTKSIFETLVHLRGQNKVRTFWENIVDEIEIPIFDIPLQRT